MKYDIFKYIIIFILFISTFICESLGLGEKPQKPGRPTPEITSIEPTLTSGRIQRYRDILELPRLTPCPVSVSGVSEVKCSLNGTWKFNPTPSGEFWKSDTSIGADWDKIQVPGEWVMQGFSVPENFAACYRRHFKVPLSWKGQRIKLRCDAIYSDAKVWINGAEAGEHEGGFTPFELDISDFLEPGGENTIVIMVKSESFSDVLSLGSRYAQHPLGGIRHKIYLFCVPELNIASLHVSTVFDKEFSNATMQVMLDIANESSYIDKTGRVLENRLRI